MLRSSLDRRHAVREGTGKQLSLLSATATLGSMTDVHLEPVTAQNWRDCADLTVRPDQSRYVAAVSYYLCLCHYGFTWQPLAIVRDGAVVGFYRWAVDDDDASRWVGGLVVAATVQRTGIARSALTALLERFERDPDCSGVTLSYTPGQPVGRGPVRVARLPRDRGDRGRRGRVVARRARTPEEPHAT